MIYSELTYVGEAVRRPKLPSEGWRSPAQTFPSLNRAGPEAGAPMPGMDRG